MRIFTLIAGACIILTACNQTSTSEIKLHMAVADVKAENLKGQVKQVETDTYLIDSITGKMGKLDSKSIETFDDSGYTVSYSNFTTHDSATVVLKYQHDARGYFTGFTSTKNGKPYTGMTTDLDSMGNYKFVTSFDSTQKTDVIYTDVKVNEYGQVTGAKGLHPDSSLKMTFTNNFDSIYYIGGESKDSVGKTTYSSSVKLNDKKDQEEVEETSVTKDSTTKTTTKYTYDEWDKTGNWTLQTVNENGKPKKIVKRIIMYKE